MKPLFAGIELGVTKFVCGLADADGKLCERVQIDTQAPEKSLVIRQVLYIRNWIKQSIESKNREAVGGLKAC